MIAFIIVLAVIALIVELISLNTPLADIEYDIAFSRAYTEPDEPFELISTVANRRMLPVSFLRIRETLPDSIIADIANGSCGFSRNFQAAASGLPAYINSRLFLMPRQSVTLKTSAFLPKRGRYFCGDTMLFAGDFLGLKETYDKRVLNRELIVLPRRADNIELISALGGFMGDVSVRRFILEDPILTLGFREYTGREPLRSISWAQSARAGSLMVKKYDYTVEPSACVILNTECPDLIGGVSAGDVIERCFSAARTVCETLEEHGIHYNFLTNATAAGATGSWSSIGDGLGAVHLEAILTGLGRATYAHTADFCTMLDKTARGATASKAYIVVTPSYLPEYRPGISRLRELSGLDVFVIEAAGEEGLKWN